MAADSRQAARIAGAFRPYRPDKDALARVIGFPLDARLEIPSVDVGHAVLKPGKNDIDRWLIFVKLLDDVVGSVVQDLCQFWRDGTLETGDARRYAARPSHRGCRDLIEIEIVLLIFF